MMIKRIHILFIIVIMIFGLTGCVFQKSPDVEEIKESPNVGKKIEQFGFAFAVPQGVTKNEVDRVFYDMDFGNVGKREAFVSIVQPEYVELGTDSEMLDKMYSMATEKFGDVENVVLETRTLGEQKAEYIGLDCDLSGLATNWQMYMLISEGKLYSFTIHIFKDYVTAETMKTIDEFVDEIRFVG